MKKPVEHTTSKVVSVLPYLCAFLLMIAPPVPAAPLFADDFESGTLNNWTINGRQIAGSTNIANVVRCDTGSLCGHLYHDRFTEISMYRDLGFDPIGSLSFDVKVSLYSDPPPGPQYYGNAAVSFLFLDSADAILGTVHYLAATTNFPFTNLPSSTTSVNPIPAGVWRHYDLHVPDLLSQITIDSTKIAKIRMQMVTYSSTWPYPFVSAELWIDNVSQAPPPASISLTPESASNPVGTSHTVTATLTVLGDPQPDILVSFSVDTGPNAGASGTCNPVTCLSDANGQVTFTYTSSGSAGTDELIACFTGGTPPVETCSESVTKEWTSDPSETVPLTDFRDVRRPAQINAGPDLCGTGQESINFTGSAGSGGDTWITVYDPLPNPPPLTLGSVSLSADVQIKQFNNAKGAGLLALFNEAAAKKGLALIAVNNGNTDRLQLVTVDQLGKRTVLTSVALGASIQQCVWYRLTMDVVVNGADLTVTGQVFQHASPTDPDSAVAGQLGPTLSFTGARPAGVDVTGEVGIVAAATSAVVDSSVTNFSQP